MTASRDETHPRARRDVPIAAGFAALFIYAAVVGGSWLGIYIVSLRVISLLTVAAALAIWAVVAWRHPRWRPRTAIWPAIVAPLLAFALSTALSPFPRLGIEYLCWAILLAALYLLLVRILATDFARARIGGLAAIVGILVGLFYVLFALRYWIEWWGLVGRPDPPPLRPAFIGLSWGNPSAVLTVSVLLLLLAAAGLGFRTRTRSVTLVVQAALTVFVVIVSGSRAGWLAIAGAIVLVGVPWLLTLRRDGVVARALSDRRVRRGLGVAAIVGVVLALVVGPGIASRFESGGDGGRPVYYAIALRMFAESPLVGTGPGTWAARRIVFTGDSELDFYIPHAHNIYFQALAELGVVGIAAQLAALACGGWLVFRAVAGDDGVRRRWGWAAAFGFVYAGLHCLFDSYANMPAVLMLLAIPIAFLDGSSDRRLGLPASLAGYARPMRATAVSALVVASVVSILVLGRVEMVALAHERAVDLIDAGDWDRALAPAAEVASTDPGMPPYQVTYGLAALAAHDWTAAASAFQAAAGLDDLSQSWIGLAVAQMELGAPKADIAASLDRALRLGVQQPSVAYAAATIYDRMGMTAQADDAYVATLVQVPALAADPSWTRDPAWSERFAGLLERAMQTNPRAAWELALVAGDPNRALSLTSASPDPSFAPIVVSAWLGGERAYEAVIALADGDPMNAFRLGWAARLSDRAGDTASAGRFRRLVDIGLPGNDSGAEARIVQDDPEGGGVYANRTLNYGTYMYRRPTPVDLLPPGLPRVVPVTGLVDPSD